MKHLPAILFIAAAVLCGSVSAPAQAEPILDFAVRVGCDFQQPELGLMDLHVLQGSTPLVLAMPKAGNTALTPDPDTGVRMIIGPSDTGSIYAVRTNYAIAGGGYAIDWPTIGTNSSGQAWFYTLLFDRDGKTYWSGSGALYIDASGYTGPDGVEWIEYTTPNVGWPNIIGDPADNTALVDYVAAHGGGSSVGGWTNLAFSGTGNAITNATAVGTTLTLERGTIEGGVADVAYGTTTNEAYRGDWGLAASNLAAQAAGWGDHAAAGYATGTPVYVESDPIFSATNAWLVRTNDAAYTATVAKAASAVQPADTNGWVVSSHSGLATEAQAGQIATNVLSTATTNSMPLIDFGGGGGGTADPFSSILVEADWTWTNGIYAVGANTSVTNISITLPDAGTNFASVVVRKFSNLNQLNVVRGTNVVYTLYDDGSTRSYDWWPQRTNWYWRQ